MKTLKVARTAAYAVVVGWAFTASADIPASAYVQRGLVAQFDGIDNVGAGTHDPNATVWKDLVGDIDFPLTGCEVSADTVSIPSGVSPTVEQSVFSPPDYSQPTTIELNWATPDLPEASSYADYFLFASDESYLYRQNNTQAIFPVLKKGSPNKHWSKFAYSTAEQRVFATASFVNGATSLTDCGFYYNGSRRERVGDATTSTLSAIRNRTSLCLSTGSRSYAVKYRSIRIYNRKLTADEIALNAAIDKVRFSGLDPMNPSSWPDGYRYSAEKGVEVRVKVRFDASRGSVTANGRTIAPDAEIWTPFNEEGASLTLSVTPLEGFCFGRWKGVPEGVDVQQTSIELTANRVADVTAEFNDLEPFVETTGTQYFITDYYAGPTTKVEADMMVTTATTDTRQQRFFGSDSDQSSWPFSFSVYQSGSDYISSAAKDGVGNWSSSGYLISTVVGKRILLALDSYNAGSSKYKLSVVDQADGKSLVSWEASSTRTKTGTRPLAIAGDSIKDPPIYPAYMRIYSVRIWEKDRLVRCYVPYWDADKSTVGLKELLSGNVVVNGGSGTPLSSGELKADSNVYLPDGYRYSEERGCEARMTVTYDETRGSVSVDGKVVPSGGEVWTPTADAGDLTLRATPAEGYALGGWLGTGTDNVIEPEITLPAGKRLDVTAVFGTPSAYVETTGAECFLTDVCAGPGTKAELDCEITAGGSDMREARYFGVDATDASENFSFSMYHNASDKISSGAQDGATTAIDSGVTVSTVLNKRILLTLDAYCSGAKPYLYAIDDVLGGTAYKRCAYYSNSRKALTFTKTAAHPMGICVDNRGTPAGYPLAKMKIHCFRVYESNALIRCYAPYWNADKSVVGLKELFTGATVTSSSGGVPLTGGLQTDDWSAYLPDGYRYSADRSLVEAAVRTSVNDATKGTVSVTEESGAAQTGAAWAKAGARVTVVATPVAGQVFRRWEGDLGDADPTQATLTLTLRAPVTLKAVFGAAVEHPLTADSYVQEGLVAQWDGIDNTGTGAHSTTATTWVDRIGNRSSTRVNTKGSGGSWGDNCYVEGASASSCFWCQDDALKALIQSGELTVEIFCCHTAVPAAGAYEDWLGFGSAAASRWLKLDIRMGDSPAPLFGGLQYRKSGWGAEAAIPDNDVFAWGADPHYGVIVCTKSGDTYTATLYGNGANKVHTVSYGTNAPTDGLFTIGGFAKGGNPLYNAKIYSVRLYSRPLTADEIVRNYEVDQLRFLSRPGDISYVPEGEKKARVDYTAATGGKVLLDGVELTNPTDFVELGEHVLTSVADDGYVFSHWAADLPGEPDADDPCVYNLLPGTYDIRPVFRKASSKVFQLTSADYIQDGLIFFYDAFENFRRMVHVSGISKWTDWMHGVSFSASDKACFDDRSYRVSQYSNGSLAIADTTAYGEAYKRGLYTMDFCYEIDRSPGPSSNGDTSGNNVFEWMQDNGRFCHFSASEMTVYFSYSKKAGNNYVRFSAPMLASRTSTAVGLDTVGVAYLDGVWKGRIAGLTQGATNWQRRFNQGYYGGGGFNGCFYRCSCYGRPLASAEILHNTTVDAVRYFGDERVRYCVMSTPRPEETACNYGTPTPAYGTYTAAYGDEVTFAMSGLTHYDLDGASAYDRGEGMRAVLKGYVVSNAFGVVSEDAAPSATSVTLKLTDFGTSVCWRFANQSLLRVTAPPVGGKVQVYDLDTGDPLTEVTDTAEIWLDEPSHVGIRAIPDAEHKFSNWSGATAVIDDPSLAETGIAVAGPLTASPVFVDRYHKACEVKWKDGLEAGSWNDGNSWAGGQVPDDGDWITIPGDRAHPISITIDAASAQLKSLVIEDGDQPVTITCSGWLTSISATNMVIGRNVKLTCPGGFTNDEMSNRVWLVASTLELREGSSVDVTGGGYGAWQGPGFVPADADADTKKRGGSHAGRQGCGRGYIQTLAPGRPYGDPAYPTAPGTGGGSANGGGAVLLQADEIVMNGTIHADAAKANAPGSGGSVLLEATTVGGHGTITASSASSSLTDDSVGGGSGGRIAIRYDVAAEDGVTDFDIACSALGAHKAKNDATTRSWVSGDMGTVWMPDARFFTQHEPEMNDFGKLLAPGWDAWSIEGDLEVTNQIAFADGFVLSVGGDLSVTGEHMYGRRLELTGGALAVGGDVLVKGAGLRLLDGVRATVAGGLALEAAGTTYMHQGADLWLQASPTNAADVGRGYAGRRKPDTSGVTATLDIGGEWKMGANTYYLPLACCTNGAVVRATATKFTMDEGSTVDATRGGCNAGYGPGRATGHTTCASYGGNGYKAAYKKYGNERWPVYPGGAGEAKEGGGLVWIKVNRMSVRGTIAASGRAGSTWSSPSAGGGILLVANSKMDLRDATLNADSGASGDPTYRTVKPAGGGRIALWSQDLVTNEMTKISVTAPPETVNAGVTPDRAEDGTIYYGTIKGMRIFVR